jgi:hypothetical protein
MSAMTETEDIEAETAVELGVPASVPATTAALLVGAPYERFRRQYALTGLVDVLGDGRILTSSIAAAIGRPVTCQDYCLAQQAREPARQAQRDRRRRVQGSGHATA